MRLNLITIGFAANKNFLPFPVVKLFGLLSPQTKVKNHNRNKNLVKINGNLLQVKTV